MITAYLAGDKVSSTSSDAFSLCDRSMWGEKRNGKIEYSPVESLALVEQGKMEIFSKGRKVRGDDLVRKIKRRDKQIETKVVVFSDLRKKGYIVKTALKFGAEFRVYSKGEKPGSHHARWLLFCVRESEKMNWHDFAAKSRVAHSTKKRLLIAVVDEEEDVTYYEAGWQRV